MAKTKITDLSDSWVPDDGDTWFDTSSEKFMVHNGNDWTLANPSFYINDAQGEHVLEITAEGEVIWHGEPTEAAKIFCETITFQYEQKGGFVESRKQWEEDRKESIRKALENGELTMDKLNEIFKKHEFLRVLKGASENKEV